MASSWFSLYSNCVASSDYVIDAQSIGKEKKGKEKKGKERKGKERKGKERKGMICNMLLELCYKACS